MIKIVLCDDHEIVRLGLRQLLQTDPKFNVLADVSSGEALLKKLKTVKPDIIILDISMPGRGGIEVLKQVKLSYPEIRVLVLSMYPEDQFAIRTIKAGADGYLHKDSAPEVLSQAIKIVAGGDKYVSPCMMNLLFEEIVSAKKGVPPHLLLSDREIEVLIKLGQGKKVGVIARELFLSIKTVSTYKKRIQTKLNINTYGEIAQYLSEHELLNITDSPTT